MSKLRFLLALFVTVVFLSPLPSEAGPFRFRGFWGSNVSCGISDFGANFSQCSSEDVNPDGTPFTSTIIKEAKSSFTDPDTGIDVVQFDVPFQRQYISDITICRGTSINCANTNGIDNSLFLGIDALVDPEGQATFGLVIDRDVVAN